MSETGARKKLQRKLRGLLDDGNPTVAVMQRVQRRPFTMVEVGATLLDFDPPAFISGVGFAKVNWPDEWDEEYGQNLCIDKALAEIARTAVTYVLNQRSCRT